MLAVLLNVVLFLLGILLGAAVSYWFAVEMKHPRLRASGGGGGRMPNGGWSQSLSVTNEPRQLRLSVGLPRTVILGRRIMWTVRLRSVMRDTAQDCTALLLDDADEVVATLWWQDGDSLTPTREIRCRETVTLRVFWWPLAFDAAAHNRTDIAYVFQPLPGPQLAPRVDDAPKYRHSTRFKIRVSYQQTSKFEVPALIKLRADGTIHVQIAGSGTG